MLQESQKVEEKNSSLDLTKNRVLDPLIFPLSPILGTLSTFFLKLFCEPRLFSIKYDLDLSPDGVFVSQVERKGSLK
jgi:hypothetical protein